MKKLFGIGAAIVALGIMLAGCTTADQQIISQIGNATFDAACANLSVGDMAFQNAVASGKITNKASIQAEHSAVLAVTSACNARPLTTANAISTALAATAQIAAYELQANK